MDLRDLKRIMVVLRDVLQDNDAPGYPSFPDHVGPLKAGFLADSADTGCEGLQADASQIGSP